MQGPKVFGDGLFWLHSAPSWAVHACMHHQELTVGWWHQLVRWSRTEMRAAPQLNEASRMIAER